MKTYFYTANLTGDIFNWFELGYSLFYNVLIYLYTHSVIFLIIFLPYIFIICMFLMFFAGYSKKIIENAWVQEIFNLFKDLLMISRGILNSCLSYMFLILMDIRYYILEYIIYRILAHKWELWLFEENLNNLYNSIKTSKFRGKSYFNVKVRLKMWFDLENVILTFPIKSLPEYIVKGKAKRLRYLYLVSVQKHILFLYLTYIVNLYIYVLLKGVILVYVILRWKFFRLFLLRISEPFVIFIKVIVNVIYFLLLCLWWLLLYLSWFYLSEHGANRYTIYHTQAALPQNEIIPIIYTASLVKGAYYFGVLILYIRPTYLWLSFLRDFSRLPRIHLKFITLMDYLLYKNVIYFINFLKFFLFKLKISKFFLFVLKSAIFLLFYFFYLFFVNYDSLYKGFRFFLMSIYIFIFKAFRGVVYLLKIFLKTHIYIYIHIIIPLFYFFIMVFWSFIVFSFKFLLRIYFFQIIFVFLLLSWIDFATTYAFWLLFLDLLSYFVGFCFSIISPFLVYINLADYLTVVVYEPYYKISFFHGYTAYVDFYYIYYDIYYYLKLKFVTFFPYKYYIYYTWFSNYRNFFIYTFHWNYFFIYAWYFYLHHFYEKYDYIFVVVPVISLLFFFIKTFYNYCIFLGYNYFDWALLWYYIFIKYLNNSLLYYGFFNMINYRLIKMLIIELIPNKEIFPLNLGSYKNSINFFIDLFLYYYDYFMFRDLQSVDESIYLPENVLLDLPVRHKFSRRVWRRTFYDHYLFTWCARRKGSIFTIYRRGNFLGFEPPTLRRIHRLSRRRLFGRHRWLWIRLVLPWVVKKWNWSHFYQNKYAIVWGRRFKFIKSYWPYWFPVYSRYNNVYFAANVVFAWTSPMDYDFFTLDADPDFGDGFLFVDVIMSGTFCIYLIFLISGLYFISSFRSVFFPKLWLPHNSEYYWKLFRETSLNNELVFYLDRKDDFEFFEDLVEMYKPKKNNYLFILKESDFNYFYDNIYNSNLDKLQFFEEFYFNVAKSHIYLTGMAINEGPPDVVYDNDTFEGKDEIEVNQQYNKPYTYYYIEERRILLRKFNKFLYNLDKLWNFKMPNFMLHKDTLTTDYYNLGGNSCDYYIPDEYDDLAIRHSQLWFIVFPLSIWYFFSIDFTSSANTLIIIEIIYRASVLFNIDSIFDFYYAVFFGDPYMMITQDALDSEGGELVEHADEEDGLYDDHFLTISNEYFADYYLYKYKGNQEIIWGLRNVFSSMLNCEVKPHYIQYTIFKYIFESIYLICLVIILWKFKAISWYYFNSTFIYFRKGGVMLKDKNVSLTNSRIFYLYEKIKKNSRNLWF